MNSQFSNKIIKEIYRTKWMSKACERDLDIEKDE